MGTMKNGGELSEEKGERERFLSSSQQVLSIRFLSSSRQVLSIRWGLFQRGDKLGRFDNNRSQVGESCLLIGWDIGVGSSGFSRAR